MNKQRKTSHILNVFQYDHATGIIGLNGAPVSGYGLYLTTNINDGSVGIDSSASINALYLLKNTTKQFEISYDTSGATKIFRLLPYQSASFFQIGNPSNAANSNSDYVFISESTYGNVLIGPGIGNAVSNLTGATASIHKVQFNGAVFANNSIQATSFKITGGASTGFLKADGTVDTLTYLSGNQSITVSGDATGSGTTSIALTLANTAVTPGVYGSTTLVPVVTVDSKGRITSVTTAAISGSLTFTGDVTGSGTTGTSTAMTLAASGVTAGTYTKVTVDSKGRVTVGASATTSDISEGTNLYYTDARVLSYLSANTYATQSYVSTQISNLVDAAPGTLDTLNELAAALGDDPNFATTVSTSIGTKVPQARTITINGTSYDLTANRSWTINSMVYPSAGIALSTGTAWGTSITDNSANWNTAFGWGNHASAGYLASATAATTYVSLTGSYANPAWITSLAYSKITGVPAFLTSYTETDPYRVTTVAVSGTSTKTITLTRADASTVTTTWTDYDTDTNTYVTSAGFSGGTLTLTRNDAGTVTVSLDGRYYLATNPSGYITGYTETDTLASVTGRGNTTTSSMAIGSGSIPNGKLYVNSGSGSDVVALQNTLNTGAYLVFADTVTPTWANAPRLGAISNDMVFKTLDTERFRIASTGASTFTGPSLTINTTGDIVANGDTFRMKGGGGSAEFIWYRNYSGSPSEPGFNINNRAGVTTFSHNVNGGGTSVSGNFSAANFSGSSSGTNTGDQTNISGNAATATTATYASYLNALTNYSWTSSSLPNTYHQGITSAFVGPNAGEGSWQNYGSVMTMRTYSGGGGSLQLYTPYGPSNGGDSLQVRFGNYNVSTGNSWTGWKTLIDSGNIGSQSVSNASTLGGNSPNTTGGASTIVQRDSNGYIQNSYFYTSGGGSERGTGISYIAGFNSSDYYIRSYTLQGLASAMSGATMNIAGTATNFNNGYAYSSGSTVYVDTLESISSTDWLELVYYGGVGVRIGTGVNGSKALYAGSLYDAGNRVYSAGNPQVNISGNSATTSQRNFDGSLTSPDFYASGWFRTSGSTAGLYNSTHNTHFYASGTGQWNFATSNNSWIQIALRPASHDSTVRGYIYADTGNNVGLLTYDGNWALRVDTNKNVQIYGSVSATNLSGTNTGDQTNISGNAGTVGGYGAGSFFRDLGFEGGGSNANTIAETRSAFTYAAGAPHSGPLAYFGAGGYGLQLNATYHTGDQNISYRVRNGDAGAFKSWYSFITSANIGSQSVSYATTAGSASSATTATTATTAARATRANGNFYIDDNYGNTIVGVYESTRYQGVFAMGDAYKLPANGTTTGNLYGLAWSHPNAGGVASNLNDHGLLVINNGVFAAAISSSIRAATDMRAPIFYDSNDTGYYLDPNSLSNLARVALNGNDNQLYINSVTNGAAGMFFQENGANKWELYHYQGRFRFYSYTTSQEELSLDNAGGYLTARTSMRAPIFYDSNDTGYYLDPNGTSNLQTWTADTAARLGRSSYWTNRWAIYNGVNGHMTGTNGWGMDHGGWGTAWKGGFSGWDIWGSSTDHPQGSGYVHAQGIISGQHAASSNGSSAYGWMMVGAHNATDNRYWLRGKWDTSTSGWVEMVTSGNISSQTVSNSDMVDGYHASNFLGYQGNSYYQVNTWLQMNGTHGVFWPSYYGIHIYANTTSTYTQLRIDGVKNSYTGVYLGDSAVNGMMYDTAGNGGVYREANGIWYFYYHIGNNCMGVGTSTTSSSYKMYVNGTVYATGDVIAYSDARKKTNIVTIDKALETVTKMRGVFYDKIGEESNGRQLGVIAQEVNKVLPEAVNYASDIDEYGVKYGNIVGVLIEAIKEQQLQIEELKNKLDNVLSSR